MCNNTNTYFCTFFRKNTYDIQSQITLRTILRTTSRICYTVDTRLASHSVWIALMTSSDDDAT